jgi:hypothetical protein
LLLLLFLVGRADRRAAKAANRPSNEGAGASIAISGDQRTNPGANGSATRGTFLSRSASDESEGDGEKQSGEETGLHGDETSRSLNK